MDPIALHVATDRLRRQTTMPRDLLVQMVQARLRCAGDEAIAAVDQLVRANYLVESIAQGVRVLRRGPQSSASLPSDETA